MLAQMVFVADLSMLIAGWFAVIYRAFKIDWRQPTARWGWLFVLAFALSATMQQNGIYTILGRITNIPTIAWYGRYIVWIGACYAGMQMIFRSFDSTVPGKKITAFTLLILILESVIYFGHIAGGNSQKIIVLAENGYEILFMVLLYIYSLVVLVLGILSLDRARRLEERPRYQVRIFLLIAAFSFASVFFVLRLSTAIMGHFQIMVSVLSPITSVAMILFLFACILFFLFFAPASVHLAMNKFGGRIAMWHTGIRLRSLYRVTRKLVNPVLGEQGANWVTWLINPRMYTNIVITHILDTKTTIAKRLNNPDGSVVEQSRRERYANLIQWDMDKWQLAERLANLWSYVNDAQPYDQLVNDYKLISQQVKRW